MATGTTGPTGVATDDRWAAGFEMGRLDQQLAARVLRDQKVGLTIRASNREEAALIAGRHGYELHIGEVEEPGCVWAEFWPAPRAAPERDPGDETPQIGRVSSPRS
ncbi:hypothetical protein [Actinomycetospora cinnamomea]|uniref:Uncharacterized protein n=1 Tax=Actinomycetospora cinnamomea TaxID=663609 RepID=A0A2U1EAY1_9PSEU|nr:hypothetical protein [Actinomycetospora cinnamomea]PVY97067.1 hypothetical protein C8D89_12615 [Actinomycetospora cinnamomea]